MRAENATLYPIARKVYEGLLADNPGDACAARGLSQLVYLERAKGQADLRQKSWPERAATAWQTEQTRLTAGWGVLAGITAAVLILLLVIARLVTPWFARPTTPSSSGGRWVVWTIGLGLLVAASLTPILTSYGGIPRPISPWWVQGPLIASLGLLSIAAILLFADKPDRGVAWLVAITGLVGVTTLVLLFLPLELPSGRVVDPLAILGAAAAVVGIAWVAYGRGTALRLQLQVTGSSGAADVPAGQLLLSRLSALGSEWPSGLKVAGASDVSTLPESALTTVPGGSWATLLFNIVRVVRPAVPWQVTATFPATDRITWLISRNGTATSSGTSIATAQEIPSGPANEKPSTDQIKDELLTACAADVLVTLASVHPQLQRGLCGVEEWRPLALHAIAVRDSTVEARQRLLLEGAIDSDINYALAALAYLRTHGHDTVQQRRTTAEKASALAKRELGLLKRQPRKVRRGYEAYEVRLLYNLSVSWLNVRQDEVVAGNTSGADRAWLTAAHAAVDLRQALMPLQRRAHLKDLAEGMQAPSRDIIAELDSTRPSGRHKPRVPKSLKDRLAEACKTLQLIEPVDRNGYYSRACYRMARSREIPDAPHRRQLLTEALDDLEQAATDTEIKAWALTDPYFAPFREPPPIGEADDVLWIRYASAVGGAPASNYLELLPFKTYAETLQRLGMTKIDSLSKVRAEDLAAATGSHPSVARTMIDIARLAMTANRSLASRRKVLSVGILQALLEVGVSDVDELRCRMKHPEQLYSDLVRASVALTMVPTRRETIANWR